VKMKTKYSLVIATICIASFAVSASGAGVSALPEELRHGLVLYYSFDSEPSAKEIVDESGEGNDGKIVNVEWIKDGHQGGAASFGPTDSYITVPNKTKLNPDVLTLAAWTKISNIRWRHIFDKGYGQGYALAINPSGFVFLKVVNAFAQPGIQVTDGQWRHVVGTFDGADVKMYINGELADKRPWKGAVPRTPYDLTIGAKRSNTKGPLGMAAGSFNGLMDDVMMFNRALSDDEVQTLFKAQGGTLGPKLGNPAPVARTPARPSAQNKPGADERLKQVKQLLDQGLIDKESYDRKVKEIVDSI
jgi:hypothetical protein